MTKSYSSLDLNKIILCSMIKQTNAQLRANSQRYEDGSMKMLNGKTNSM